jgi:hypothetical protein
LSLNQVSYVLQNMLKHRNNLKIVSPKKDK